jgi:hypothetical protein
MKGLTALALLAIAVISVASLVSGTGTSRLFCPADYPQATLWRHSGWFLLPGFPFFLARPARRFGLRLWLRWAPQRLGFPHPLHSRAIWLSTSPVGAGQSGLASVLSATSLYCVLWLGRSSAVCLPFAGAPVQPNNSFKPNPLRGSA